MLQTKVTFTPVQTNAAGRITFRRTNARLSLKDRLGGMRVRWSIGRNDYRVEPGLYACGNPDGKSPVLVTANYKLTFDGVRKELEGIDVWLLVLDTKGVNVWCAAGKGTFGTEELLARITATKLASIVEHRELIVPQLGASGVAGFRVTAASGFRVRFGPVYAKDLPEYLASGMKKNDRMKRVTFTLRERLAVAPVELVHALKFAIPVIVAAFLASLPPGSAYIGRLVLNLVMLCGSFFVGTIIFPAIMPLLPFKAFSAKGAVLGAVWAAAVMGTTCAIAGNAASVDLFGLIPGALVSVSIISFLAMNFTGSSTFTCQKGAELEVRISLPLQIIMTGAAILFAIIRVATGVH